MTRETRRKKNVTNGESAQGANPPAQTDPMTVEPVLAVEPAPATSKVVPMPVRERGVVEDECGICGYAPCTCSELAAEAAALAAQQTTTPATTPTLENPVPTTEPNTTEPVAAPEVPCGEEVCIAIGLCVCSEVTAKAKVEAQAAITRAQVPETSTPKPSPAAVDPAVPAAKAEPVQPRGVVRDIMTFILSKKRPDGTQIRLTKTRKADGSILDYDKPKFIYPIDRTVTCFDDMVRELSKAEHRDDVALIRGQFGGPEVPKKGVQRTLDNFPDRDHHWIMIDIDGFSPVADPVGEPAAAIEEYIQAKLPECFHYRRCFWQLSASAGHPDKPGLRAHLFFWLKTAYGAGALHAWWVLRGGMSSGIDGGLFNAVQAHFVSRPVFEEGALDPVPVWSGIIEGFEDEVDLVVAESLLAQVKVRDRSGETGEEYPDPGERKWFGAAFCRAYDIDRCLEEFGDILPFEFESLGDDRRMNFIDGEHAPGGVFITPCRNYMVNKHTSSPFGVKPTNAFDLIRHYRFGHLDGDDGFDDDPTCSTSYHRMKEWAATLPEVQAELATEREEQASEERDSSITAYNSWLERIDAQTDGYDLDQVIDEIKADSAVADIHRDMLAGAIHKRFKKISSDGTSPRTLAAIKKVLKPRPLSLQAPTPADGEVRVVPRSQELNMAGFPDLRMNENGVSLKCTLENVEHLLRSYGVVVRYDVVKKGPVVHVPGLSSSPEEANNTSDTQVMSLARRNDLLGTKDEILSYVAAIAQQPENLTNPLADWIMSKPWDGQDRIKPLCQTLTVADGYPIPVRDLLVRRWLVSAAAALLKPVGFWSKGVLVFQGLQSLGKTTWVENLLPPDLGNAYILVGEKLDPGDRDNKMKVLSHFIVEMGELDATFKKDIALLKAFISQRKDVFRRPFARGDSHYQRRTVFFASVNPEMFLIDPTGNVRFWTIPVEGVDYEHDIDRQQLWAQLARLFQDGERWWLIPEEEALLEEENTRHQAEDPMKETLSAVFEKRIASWGGDEVKTVLMTASDVLRGICEVRNPTVADARRCGAALRALLGKPRKSSGNLVWDVPDDGVWESQPGDPPAGG